MADGRWGGARLSGAARVAVPPVLLAALLVLLDRPRAALPLAVLGLLVGVASLVVPTIPQHVARLFALVGHVVGVALSWLLLAPVFVLVIVPAGVLLRLVRWRPLGAGTWTQRRRADLAARTYSRERDQLDRGSTPRRWATGMVGLALFGVVALLAANVVATTTGIGDDLLAELNDRTDLADPVAALRGEQAEAPAPAPSGTDEPDEGGDEVIEGAGAVGDHNLLAHQDEPWASDMFAEVNELHWVYDPLLFFRFGEHEGDYVNQVDGERRTYRQADPGEEPLQVWFLGGSAMWGLGQRDEHTIASDVVRLAEQDGVPVEGHNLAVNAYTSWQEHSSLGLALTARGTPDLVVVYDGFNDVGEALSSTFGVAPGTAFNEEIEEQLTGADGSLDPWPGDRETRPTSEEVAAAYRRPMELMHGMARAFDFEIASYVQPSLSTIELTEAEAPVLEFAGMSVEDAEGASEVYRIVVESVDDLAIDLTDALDDEPRPVVYDWVHTNESGARAVAEAMYETLGPRLEQLAEQRDETD